MSYEILVKLRLATPDDDRKIHDAHMRSINEVCSKDYSQEEIFAWGGREYIPGQWRGIMQKDSVWVLEGEEQIFGFCHLRLLGQNLAEIMGLYLVPEAIGQGYGKKAAKHAINYAREKGCTNMVLGATRTGIQFYKKIGFYPTGEEQTLKINGVPIPYLPMEMAL